MSMEAGATRTHDSEQVRVDKRDNSSLDKSGGGGGGVEVDTSAPDPECAASLIGYGEAADGGDDGRLSPR